MRGGAVGAQPTPKCRRLDGPALVLAGPSACAAAWIPPCRGAGPSLLPLRRRRAPRACRINADMPRPMVLAAEAGKFPLKELFKAGKAGVYADHGFASSQAAALPVLWFEAGAPSPRPAVPATQCWVGENTRLRTKGAPTIHVPCLHIPAFPRLCMHPPGDMHGEDDDGYPVVPQPGFAPFVMMLQRHVPWADERLRGSYYQRAWQVRLACSQTSSNWKADSWRLRLSGVPFWECLSLHPCGGRLPLALQLGMPTPTICFAAGSSGSISQLPRSHAAPPAGCAARRRLPPVLLEYSMWCSPTLSQCSCHMTRATAAARRRSKTSCRWVLVCLRRDISPWQPNLAAVPLPVESCTQG